MRSTITIDLQDPPSVFTHFSNLFIIFESRERERESDRSASFYFYRYYRGGYATMEKSASHVGGISPAFARRKENRVNGLYESGESSSGSRGRDSHRRMDARQDGVRTKEEGREDPPR